MIRIVIRKMIQECIHNSRIKAPRKMEIVALAFYWVFRCSPRWKLFLISNRSWDMITSNSSTLKYLSSFFYISRMVEDTEIFWRQALYENWFEVNFKKLHPLIIILTQVMIKFKDDKKNIRQVWLFWSRNEISLYL